MKCLEKSEQGVHPLRVHDFLVDFTEACKLFNGTDFGTKTFVTKKSIPSAYDCCTMCRSYNIEDYQCGAWTWNREAKTCELKIASGSESSHKDAVSGIPNPG